MGKFAKFFYSHGTVHHEYASLCIKSFVAKSKKFDAVNQSCNLKLHCQLRNFIKAMQKCATTTPPLCVEIRSAYLTNIHGTVLSA